MSWLRKPVRVRGGWFSLFGGLFIGIGIVILIVAPLAMILEEVRVDEVNDILNSWKSLHPYDSVPTARVPLDLYYNFANLQLVSAGIVFMGVILGAIGIYDMYSSTKTLSPKPSVTVSVGKKYCRYCGTETKSDTVFCEKCGNKISETQK